MDTIGALTSRQAARLRNVHGISEMDTIGASTSKQAAHLRNVQGMQYFTRSNPPIYKYILIYL